MTSSCVILLCSAIFCHLTLGYDNARYGKLGIVKQEAKNEENHVLNRIVNHTLGDKNSKKSSVETKSNISEEPTPEPERKATSPMDNGDKTSPQPTSETSPADNGNDTSPEPTSETSAAANVNDTSPEPTSETSPAANVNDTSPEPTSETSPAANVNDTSPEPESETSPAVNVNDTSPEPTSETSPAPNVNVTSPEPNSETSPAANVNDTSPEPTSETSPAVNVNDTSPEPTSETSPPVNVNDTSPEPENETIPSVNVNDTSPEPTSETSPAVNVNDTSPEPTSETSPAANVNDTSPEPTSETSPAVNVNDTSPEPTSETSPAVNVNDTSPEPTSETSPAVNVNDTSPEPTSETSPAVNVNDTSPEPTIEPDDKDSEGDSEPEDEPDSEPEGEEEPKPESELDAFAEPGPDWVLAKEVWQGAWEFHVYFFGVAFALLGLYCFITLIRLWNTEHLISKPYFITLNLLVMIVCILRSLYLLLDAYNSLGTFPVGVDYFMYSTAFPCLTALFSLLFYSLLLATRVRIMSKKVHKLWVLLVIVIFHFVLSIATDIVVGFYSSASVMILVCQVFFLVWGLLMFIGYFIIFRKLYKGAIHHKKALTGLQHEHKRPVLKGHGHQSKPKHKFMLAMKITFFSAVAGVAIVGFELYGMFGVYGALNADSKPKPWPWWTYHLIVRTLELLMCVSVTFVAGQPLRYKKKNSNRRIYHYMLPCSMYCCASNIEQTETVSSSVNRDFSLSRVATIAQEDSSNT